MNAKTKKILKIVGNVALWLFVAFAVAITALVMIAQNDSDGIPTIGGNGIINVQSDSMSPTFRTGDMLFVKKVSAEQAKELQVGDIITYKVDLNGDGTEELNTHRIVRVTEGEYYTTYKTQGDNKETNMVEDDYDVVSGSVIATWDDDGGMKLNGLGSFLSFLQTQLGFFLIIVLPLAGFFIFELVHFILTLNSVRNAGKAPKETEDEMRARIIAELKAQQTSEAPAQSDEAGNTSDAVDKTQPQIQADNGENGKSE